MHLTPLWSMGAVSLVYPLNGDPRDIPLRRNTVLQSLYLVLGRNAEESLQHLEKHASLPCIRPSSTATGLLRSTGLAYSAILGHQLCQSRLLMWHKHSDASEHGKLSSPR